GAASRVGASAGGYATPRVQPRADPRHVRTPRDVTTRRPPRTSARSRPGLVPSPGPIPTSARPTLNPSFLPSLPLKEPPMVDVDRSRRTLIRTSGARPLPNECRTPVIEFAAVSARDLLEQVRRAIGSRHYSVRTERAYAGWIRRYLAF